MPATARSASAIHIERGEWRTLGWNNSCSVGLVYLAYPRLGEAIHDEPVMTRVGTISIEPGMERAKLYWTLEADGALTWNSRAVAAAEKDLAQAGFVRRGFHETIRPGPDGPQPGLAETLHSTATLSARVREGWPGTDWRWAAAEFNPLSTCALLVFEKTTPEPAHRFQLVRVYNTRARLERARAHTTNARLLFDAGDLPSAAAEAETGAGLAPELALTRYHHAALLALRGHTDRAMTELAAAVGLDPKYKTRARKDQDFKALAEREDFRRLMK